MSLGKFPSHQLSAPGLIGLKTSAPDRIVKSPTSALDHHPPISLYLYPGDSWYKHRPWEFVPWLSCNDIIV
jgi:hypothetical protein